jgi:hypothetical protein
MAATVVRKGPRAKRNVSPKRKVMVKVSSFANDPFILQKERGGKALIAKYGLPNQLLTR